GALSHVSLRGHADIFNEPLMFAALSVAASGGSQSTRVARVLEGPVPTWKIFGTPGAGNGLGGTSYGLPRFAEATFETRFPFGTVTLRDAKIPLDVTLTGWSPFTPGDADSSSLPVAALEYRFANPTGAPVDAVFSFHARNFFVPPNAASGAVFAAPGGFTVALPEERATFSATVDDAAFDDVKGVAVNCAWFRGGWFDAPTIVWKTIAEGAMPEAGPVTEGAPSPGGSLYVPLHLEPGEEKVIRVRLAWHAPETGLRVGKDQLEDNGAPSDGVVCDCVPGEHVPWYASVFPDIDSVNAYWRAHYDDLRARTAAFTECFYDTTLPPEVIEAVAANLTILKSPTVQRQTDGRLWCWEGCHDKGGCCHGSCTHVWNYAQAIPHLFPEMERSLRYTEFFADQDERGHQTFRANLPIRPVAHDFHAASDGQLGGVMKVYREWRIFGNELWLRKFWPKVKQSLDYCIATWDPDHTGTLVEPHHNTYDIEFWGPDGMCTSFYLGALKAATLMADALGEKAPLYAELLEKGVAAMESELWNGEYFIQKIQWEGLHAGDPTQQQQSWNVNYSPEAQALMQKEGPKYQYGNGCLADGVLGTWIAAVCGVEEFLDREQVRGHLLSVYHYNLRHDLSEHVNPQRPSFALGKDGGLLLCTWPHGDALTLPFPYANEVWTGYEYQVASHLMLLGEVDAGLDIVRTARDRYDGRVRNPFNEYECGHWYARAMASYGLLQGLTGVRYDAVEKVLYIQPNISGDFRAFLSTATGYGTVGVKDGTPFVEVKHGAIPFEKIVYVAI
ncbi:MAG: GH116 family glycosyl hydrolase, partial [Anaerolineae bacterium]